MTKPIIIVFLLACYHTLVYAQTIDPKEFDYSFSDSIALTLPKNCYNSISSLAEALTKNLKSDHEKFRVIFRWITDNIEYSHSNTTRDANKVLIKRKAVCEGYASLLKALCDKIGIECQIITGYAKNKVVQIGEKFKETNHAWNIVKLYDKWYLVDATWAAGTYDNKFFKKYNNSYFLSDPKFFILSHFPVDNKYQFLDTACSMKDFIKFPIVYSSSFTPIIETNGKLGKDLLLRFEAKKIINKVSIKFITDKYSRPILFENYNGYCEINYKFKPSEKGEFTLFIDDEGVFGFMKK